jgi:hypothetical protein
MELYFVTEPSTLRQVERFWVIVAHSVQEAKQLIGNVRPGANFMYICRNVTEYPEPAIITSYDGL